MTRRVLLGACLPAALLALAGCADETRQTGTTVETTPEDIKGFEAAEESYKNMGKEQSKRK